ncbi:cell wall-binding repeat-containing protein [Euzebya sp.]|uniref:cell wall-binding repeat-containing protein n=1 Tax=Euzebya sp. TaxID=1971409 RepID=UPI0035129C26
MRTARGSRPSPIAVRLIGAALCALVALAAVQWPATAQDPTQGEGEGQGSRRVGAVADPVRAAIRLSGEAFADGQAEGAVIARSDLFADALAGAALAGATRPILYTAGGPDAPADPRVLAEVARAVGPPRGCDDADVPGGFEVALLGGTAAISPAVEQAVADLGYCTQRIAGDGREHTARLIADRLGPVGGTVDRVLVARGDDPADAATAGAYAARTGTPLLVTPTTLLHPEVEQYLTAHAVDEVVVIGGEAAISEAVARGLDERAGTVLRVAGPSRDATAGAIATELWPAEAVEGVMVLNGFTDTAWVHAIAGGPLAATAGTPQLYTQTSTLPPGTDDALDALVEGAGDRDGGGDLVGLVAGAPADLHDGLAVEVWDRLGVDVDVPRANRTVLTGPMGIVAHRPGGLVEVLRLREGEQALLDLVHPTYRGATSEVVIGVETTDPTDAAGPAILTLLLVDVETGWTRPLDIDRRGTISDIAVSPDGGAAYVALTPARQADGTTVAELVRVDLAVGEVTGWVATEAAGDAAVQVAAGDGAAFGLDGGVVARRIGGQVDVLHATSLQPSAVQLLDVVALAGSGDGSTFVTVDAEALTVHRAEDPRNEACPPLDRLALNPSGTTVVGVSPDADAANEVVVCEFAVLNPAGGVDVTGEVGEVIDLGLSTRLPTPVVLGTGGLIELRGTAAPLTIAVPEGTDGLAVPVAALPTDQIGPTPPPPPPPPPAPTRSADR